MSGLFRRRQVTYADVVREYGAVLAKPAKGAALTRRTADLPYAIGLIKEAICQIAIDGRATATRDQLKAGFMELADFVDEQPVSELRPLPSIHASKGERISFLENTIKTLESGSAQPNEVSARMAKLAHEFEARCKFIEVAADA